MAGLEVEEIDQSGIGPVFVTKTTPNRGDWLSMTGVAREAAAALAAHGGVELRASKLGHGNLPKPSLNVPIRIDVPDWCPRYAAMIVEIKHPGTSPSWMQERLTAAGMRPINAVVDVTNYVMLELGQPLHAFDLDTMAGPEILVRAAREGESIVTLDGKERTLTPEIMVIADQEKASAIAGLMGGEGSEVTESTRRVLIESAHFDPMKVRAAAKSLGLSTDASYRFERFVDPSGVTRALLAAVKLIAELTDGEIIDGCTDLYPKPIVPRRLQLRAKRAEQILGMPLTGGKGDAGLNVMGFHFEPGDDPVIGRTVVVPTHRPDITLEIDLIEELGRMIGYENLPETLPPARSSHGGGHDSPEGKLIALFRNILIGQGLTEVFTHTLAAPSAFDNPAQSNARVKIRTALSAELSGLRQSLVPNVLEVFGRNARLRIADISIFEVGKVFSTSGPGKFSETLRAAAVVQGDYFAARGITENVFAALKIDFPNVFATTETGMHPGRCADLTIDGSRVGMIAEVVPDMLDEHLGVPGNLGRVSAFEIDLSAICQYIPSNIRYYPAPRFPEVTRDLAMLFDADVHYGKIESVAKLAAGEYLESVALVSVYTGERIGEGKKSVAIRFTLRADDRTLTDADADSALVAAETALAQQLGALKR